MSPRKHLLTFVFLFMGACGPAEPVDVIDPALWTVMLPDPLDPGVTCGEEALVFEEGLVEVDTNACNHVTVSQPALTRVREGDFLDLFAFHSALSALEPSTGRMAVWLDDALLWEVTPSIPSAEGIYIETVVSPVDMRRGAPVQLHVSNHGANSWRFVSLERP